MAENIHGVAAAARSTAQGAADSHTADELAHRAADMQELVDQFRYEGSGARVGASALPDHRLASEPGWPKSISATRH